MRLVLDMNVSAEWVAFLRAAGHDASHWSSVGDARAPDGDILKWAADHDHTITTQDLDFGARLAVGDLSRPSVLPLRVDGSLPEDIGDLVLSVLKDAEGELDAGALVVLDERHARVRPLPFRAKA